MEKSIGVGGVGKGVHECVDSATAGQQQVPPRDVRVRTSPATSIRVRSRCEQRGQLQSQPELGASPSD
eukprot:3827197-Heterocapsa_arctica.AAC.1